MLVLSVSMPAYAQHGNFIDHLIHDEAYLQLFWESNYVSEGRDNLDGAAIQSSLLSVKYKHFELFVWNGWGYDADYNELNVTPTFYYDYQDFSFYFSYNRLQFTEQGLNDNEIGNGISYSGLAENLYLDFDWYYSFDAEGAFFEISIAKVIERENIFRLEPRVIVGVNQNYIADGHNGLNHIALQLTAEYKLLESLNLHGKLSYSHAINRDTNRYAGDVLLRSLVWGSMGLELLF